LTQIKNSIWQRSFPSPEESKCTRDYSNANKGLGP